MNSALGNHALELNITVVYNLALSGSVTTDAVTTCVIIIVAGRIVNSLSANDASGAATYGCRFRWYISYLHTGGEKNVAVGYVALDSQDYRR